MEYSKRFPKRKHHEEKQLTFLSNILTNKFLFSPRSPSAIAKKTEYKLMDSVEQTSWGVCCVKCTQMPGLEERVSREEVRGRSVDGC